ncbi:MAG: 4Fe-4S binding protein [Elusimicrobia bacterium]|nr:4Fe-4S binding protein [Elusimicrobiota bacterium]
MEAEVKPGERAAAAGLFAALVFVPALVFASVIAGREISRFYALAWSLLAGAAAFAIAYTGRVSYFRRIFFGLSAAAFLVHFKLGLLSKALAPSCFADTPFCHIAMAPYFLNYLYQQYLALMSGDWRLWGPLTLGAAWLFVTLAIGRGWCSWACFYGGIDDSLSALPGKPALKIDRWALKFRDFPAALLIFFMLVSLAYMLPQYCLWLCPFKLTDTFLNQEGGLRAAQYGLMILALAALLAAPVLTRRRFFCSFLCPFAAWQAFWGRLNPFRLSADAASCNGCARCAGSCPVTAIKCEPGKTAEILAYCNLCGQCLEACPASALRYTVFGLELPERAGALGRLASVKYFYVFSALTLGTAFTAFWVPAAMHDVVRLIAR